MPSTHIKSKINGRKVKGQGHLQPGKNNWIGVFEVPYDLLKDDSSNWPSAIVEYEGIFSCKKKSTVGKGRGKIIHVRMGNSKKEVIINIEGDGSPELENKSLEKSLRFGYNENLCPLK